MSRLSVKVLAVLGVMLLSSSAFAESQEEMNAQMQEATQQWSQAMAGLGNAMAQAMGQAPAAGGQSVAIEAISFRELKTLLKPKLGSLALEKASGETNKAMGMNISFAEGVYRDEKDGSRVKVKITDMGSMSGFGHMANNMWANMEIDRESSDGSSERTLDLNGRKAMEKIRSSGWAELTALAGQGRFSVELSGDVKRNVAVLYDAIKDVDMNQLDTWQATGSQAQ